MKSRIKTHFIILLILLTVRTLAQQKSSTQKSTDMKNKETLKKLYEVMNGRQFETLDNLIAKDYKNKNQQTGPDAFLADIKGLLAAFPDGKWKVTAMIAEDNRVVVVQEFSGTQTGRFQFIEPTGRNTVTPGIVIYDFENGLIIEAKAETSQLKFFQDLGLLPTDITSLAKKEAQRQVALIDKIIIPKAAAAEVMKQTHGINQFISALPGLVSQQAFEQDDAEGTKTLITAAIWENNAALAHARELVQAEFQRVNLNPQELFSRLGVKMERAIYQVSAQ